MLSPKEYWQGPKSHKARERARHPQVGFHAKSTSTVISGRRVCLCVCVGGAHPLSYTVILTWCRMGSSCLMLYCHKYTGRKGNRVGGGDGERESLSLKLCCHRCMGERGSSSLKLHCHTDVRERRSGSLKIPCHTDMDDRSSSHGPT